MKLKILYIAISVLLLSPILFASVFISDDGTIVSRGEIIDDDLYLMGDFCETNGKVTGDITGLCFSRVTNEGNIEGSANLISQLIELDGNIGQSARLVGYYIEIYGSVQKNILAIGDEIILDKKAVVGKNLDAFGDVITILGTVNGDLNVTASSVIISGKIIGDVNINAEEISIEQSAIIEGNFEYSSPDEAFIDEDAQIMGRISWEETDFNSGFENIRNRLSGLTSLISIFIFFMTLIMGYFLIIVFKNITGESAHQIQTRFPQSLAVGFLSFLIFTFGAVIFALTVIGIPIGLFLIGLGFLLFYIGKVFVAIAIGRIIIRAFKSNTENSLGWEFLIGLIILSILFQIPMLGFALYIITFITGTGGVILGHHALNNKLKTSEKLIS